MSLAWSALDQAGVPGQDDDLSPVGYLQLAVDRGDVVGDRLRRDGHPLGDLGVADPSGDKVEHFASRPVRAANGMSRAAGAETRPSTRRAMPGPATVTDGTEASSADNPSRTTG